MSPSPAASSTGCIWPPTALICPSPAVPSPASLTAARIPPARLCSSRRRAIPSKRPTAATPIPVTWSWRKISAIWRTSPSPHLPSPSPVTLWTRTSIPPPPSAIGRTSSRRSPSTSPRAAPPSSSSGIRWAIPTGSRATAVQWPGRTPSPSTPSSTGRPSTTASSPTRAIPSAPTF